LWVLLIGRFSSSRGLLGNSWVIVSAKLTCLLTYIFRVAISTTVSSRSMTAGFDPVASSARC